jgi:glycerophosphoryl diester phosphodiesterase
MLPSLPRLTALLLAVASLLLLAAVPAAQAAAPKPAADEAAPIVIGHRGASGYRPEHTLAAYALAARMGADYVEPDLVSRRTASSSPATRTRSAARPTWPTSPSSPTAGPRRRSTARRSRAGSPRTSRSPSSRPCARRSASRSCARRNTLYDGRYTVPTLQEVIFLTNRLSRELGRRIGIYPETKHPSYFRSIGLPLETPLVEVLRDNDLDRRRARVFVQSFEQGNLRELDRVVKVPLVQLLPASGPEGAATPQPTLGEIDDYADGVGPSKTLIVPRDATGASGEPTSFVDDAHARGLLVHPYTFRNENAFLPLELRRAVEPPNDPLSAYGDAFAEYAQFFALGVDGVFSDNPDTAVEAREEFLATRGAQALAAR